MSVQVAVGVYLVVHALGVYVLRASNTWQLLFGPSLALAPDKTPDPLRVAPRGWIENHSFWDLDTDHADEPSASDTEAAFWGDGQRQRNVG